MNYEELLRLIGQYKGPTTPDPRQDQPATPQTAAKAAQPMAAKGSQASEAADSGPTYSPGALNESWGLALKQAMENGHRQYGWPGSPGIYRTQSPSSIRR